MNLKDAFPVKDLIYKVESCGVKNNKPWAKLKVFVAPYAMLDRLDHCLTTWSDEYIKCEGGVWEVKIRNQTGLVRCGLSAYNHYEAYSRAAMKWGIGRYLYRLDFPLWAEFVHVDRKQQGIQEVFIEERKHYYLPPRLPMWALCEEEKLRRRKKDG